ncbi:hypothetical protein Y032_0002g1080 [Ancylostoma ceylanicum]|uniref:Uncharacterized protein n=1 Tax=Ancylostoma ceylanicum TaxID=53326 RepID=A0A016W156_9BILA|nr:hypothetical protein Y032_0002g1080 [Ancylostoma ceylanicum]
MRPRIWSILVEDGFENGFRFICKGNFKRPFSIFIRRAFSKWLESAAFYRTFTFFNLHRSFYWKKYQCLNTCVIEEILKNAPKLTCATLHGCLSVCGLTPTVSPFCTVG